MSEEQNNFLPQKVSLLLVTISITLIPSCKTNLSQYLNYKLTTETAAKEHKTCLNSSVKMYFTESTAPLCAQFCTDTPLQQKPKGCTLKTQNVWDNNTPKALLHGLCPWTHRTPALQKSGLAPWWSPAAHSKSFKFSEIEMSFST